MENPLESISLVPRENFRDEIKIDFYEKGFIIYGNVNGWRVLQILEYC